MRFLSRASLLSTWCFVRAFPPKSSHPVSYGPLLLTRIPPNLRVAPLSAKPKRGSIVDTYQTVSVNCRGCGARLFRYKKKNGTKSQLIKCFVERITEDCLCVLDQEGDEFSCPSCNQRFARATTIRGLPALKLVGGKTRMTKK